MREQMRLQEQELERQERQLVYEQKVTVQGPLVGLAGGGECGSCQDRAARSQMSRGMQCCLQRARVPLCRCVAAVSESDGCSWQLAAQQEEREARLKERAIRDSLPEVSTHCTSISSACRYLWRGNAALTLFAASSIAALKARRRSPHSSG